MKQVAIKDTEGVHLLKELSNHHDQGASRVSPMRSDLGSSIELTLTCHGYIRVL